MELKSLNTQGSQLVKYKNGLLVAAKEHRAFVDQAYSDQMLEDAQDISAVIQLKIKKIEKRMKQVVEQDPAIKKLYELVISVKGIGLINAVLFLVHTNAFTGFDNPRQYACYIGVAPFGQSSGTSLNIPDKVSQLANKKLKAMLTQAANTAVLHDKELNKYYHRKLDQGKNKYAVLNAVKNKLIHRVFAVVKRGTPYVELNRYA